MVRISGWELLRSMVKLMEPMLSLTNTFGGSTYVTSSQVVLFILHFLLIFNQYN